MCMQTLIFIRRESPAEILLGLKRRGFGDGKWNGYGGKCKPDESPSDCIRRELLEESRLVVEERDLMELGWVQFSGPTGEVHRKVYIYTSNKYEGEPTSTEEMEPRWFPQNALPYKDMWEDSEHWMHLVINRVQFNATFYMDHDNKVIRYTVELL